MTESFKVIDVPKGWDLLPCPFCGSKAELNEYNDGSLVYTKVVCCTNSGELGEAEECVMYLPSQVAYKPTKRDAIAVWNKRAI